MPSKSSFHALWQSLSGPRARAECYALVAKHGRAKALPVVMDKQQRLEKFQLICVAHWEKTGRLPYAAEIIEEALYGRPPAKRPRPPNEPPPDDPEALPLPVACDLPDERGPPGERNRPPGNEPGQAAMSALDDFPRSHDTAKPVAPTTPPPTTAQLRCAGCGVAGEPPRIVYDRSRDKPTFLRPRWGWRPDGPVLLCEICERKLDRRKARTGKPGRRP